MDGEAREYSEIEDFNPAVLEDTLEKDIRDLVAFHVTQSERSGKPLAIHAYTDRAHFRETIRSQLGPLTPPRYAKALDHFAERLEELATPIFNLDHPTEAIRLILNIGTHPIVDRPIRGSPTVHASGDIENSTLTHGVTAGGAVRGLDPQMHEVPPGFTFLAEHAFEDPADRSTQENKPPNMYSFNEYELNQMEEDREAHRARLNPFSGIDREPKGHRGERGEEIAEGAEAEGWLERQNRENEEFFKRREEEERLRGGRERETEAFAEGRKRGQEFFAQQREGEARRREQEEAGLVRQENEAAAGGAAAIAQLEATLGFVRDHAEELSRGLQTSILMGLGGQIGALRGFVSRGLGGEDLLARAASDIDKANEQMAELRHLREEAGAEAVAKAAEEGAADTHRERATAGAEAKDEENRAAAEAQRERAGETAFLGAERGMGRVEAAEAEVKIEGGEVVMREGEPVESAAAGAAAELTVGGAEAGAEAVDERARAGAETAGTRAEAEGEQPSEEDRHPLREEITEYIAEEAQKGAIAPIETMPEAGWGAEPAAARAEPERRIEEAGGLGAAAEVGAGREPEIEREAGRGAEEARREGAAPEAFVGVPTETEAEQPSEGGARSFLREELAERAAEHIQEQTMAPVVAQQPESEPLAARVEPEGRPEEVGAPATAAETHKEPTEHETETLSERYERMEGESQAAAVGASQTGAEIEEKRQPSEEEPSHPIGEELKERVAEEAQSKTVEPIETTPTAEERREPERPQAAEGTAQPESAQTESGQPETKEPVVGAEPSDAGTPPTEISQDELEREEDEQQPSEKDHHPMREAITEHIAEKAMGAAAAGAAPAAPENGQEPIAAYETPKQLREREAIGLAASMPEGARAPQAGAQTMRQPDQKAEAAATSGKGQAPIAAAASRGEQPSVAAREPPKEPTQPSEKPSEGLGKEIRHIVGHFLGELGALAGGEKPAPREEAPQVGQKPSSEPQVERKVPPAPKRTDTRQAGAKVASPRRQRTALRTAIVPPRRRSPQTAQTTETAQKHRTGRATPKTRRTVNVQVPVEPFASVKKGAVQAIKARAAQKAEPPKDQTPTASARNRPAVGASRVKPPPKTKTASRTASPHNAPPRATQSRATSPRSVSPARHVPASPKQRSSAPPQTRRQPRAVTGGGKPLSRKPQGVDSAGQKRRRYDSLPKPRRLGVPDPGKPEPK